MKRLGPELSVFDELIPSGTFLQEQNGGVMNKHPLQAIRLWRTASFAVALIVCMVIAICAGSAGPAFAAERTVLCEEFTNIR